MPAVSSSASDAAAMILGVRMFIDLSWVRCLCGDFLCAREVGVRIAGLSLRPLRGGQAEQERFEIRMAGAGNLLDDEQRAPIQTGRALRLARLQARVGQGLQ